MTTEPTAVPAPPAAPATVVPTFTQDQLTAHATREAAEARRQALREVSEKLGCTVDEAEQILKDRQQADEARLSELEKREKATSAKEGSLAQREAAVVAAEHRNKVRDALVKAGIKGERLAFAHLDVASDADDAAVEAAVTAYKQSVPEWFSEQESAPTAPPPTTGTPSGDPGKPPPPAGRPSEDAYNRGAERAKSWSNGGGVSASTPA